MHVFQIRGLSGLLLIIGAALVATLLLLALPAGFMMVLWNALVYEGLKGPEIDLYQGILLWGAVMVALKLIFKPEIKLQFQSMPAKGKKKAGKTDSTDSKESKEPVIMKDSSAD